MSFKKSVLSRNRLCRVERKLTFIHSTEILSPKVIQDRQAISPTKATNVSFPYKLEQNGSGGKNMNIER